MLSMINSRIVSILRNALLTTFFKIYSVFFGATILSSSFCLVSLLSVLFSFIYPFALYSSDVFQMKFQEGKDYLDKGDLMNSYISFSVAYEYAESNTQRFDVMMNLANILFIWGDTFAAEEVYKTALGLNPKSFEALKKVVIVKAENQARDFKLYLSKIPQDKRDSEILYYWGKYTLLAEKDPKRACDILDSVRRESELFYKASYLCGVAMIMLGDRSEALRRFENSSLSPDKNLREHSYLAIARIYTDVGQFEKALPYYLRIPPDSPVFYESKYEVCWVFYALDRYDEVRNCIAYFKNAPKSHLTRKIDILQAFLNMREDLVNTLLTFTAVSDYSVMMLSKIDEVKNMPKKFWGQDYIKYFSAHEPNIKSFIEFFPEYKEFSRRKTYIAQTQAEIKSIIQDIRRINSMSVIVADKAIKKYLERVWVVQQRIINLMNSFVSQSSADFNSKNTWFALSSLFEELRKLDFTTRELIAISSVKIAELSREGGFKNWEKKFEAYNKAMDYSFKELDKLLDYNRRSANYFVMLAKKISQEYDGRKMYDIGEILKTFEDSQNVFFSFADIWQDMIKSVAKFLSFQERKLMGINHVLNNFLTYLDDFEKSLVRYIMLSKLKNEFFRIYALAQYGFIETSWILKEKESEVLDKMHVLRLQEENKIRDDFSKIQDSLDKIVVDSKPFKADSVFEEEIKSYEIMADGIVNSINSSFDVFNKGNSILFVPPQDINQIIMREQKDLQKEMKRKKEERNIK